VAANPKNAPKTVWNYPQYHHNMACIEVGLGNLPAALKNATSAAHLNKNALRQMLKDPDLKPIWGPLKQNTKDIRYGLHCRIQAGAKKMCTF
jgi:hypothetical protein